MTFPPHNPAVYQGGVPYGSFSPLPFSQMFCLSMSPVGDGAVTVLNAIPNCIPKTFVHMHVAIRASNLYLSRSFCHPFFINDNGR